MAKRQKPSAYVPNDAWFSLYFESGRLNISVRIPPSLMGKRRRFASDEAYIAAIQQCWR